MRSLVALVVLVLAAPGGLAAQDAPLRVLGADDTTLVAAALTRGYPAFPVRALRALGAEIDAAPRRTRIVLFDDTIEVAATSPFVRTPRGVAQLASPAYRVGERLYLPRAFFSAWLPRRYDGRIAFRDGTLRRTDLPTVAARTEPAESETDAPAEPPADAAPDPSAEAPDERAPGAAAGEAGAYDRVVVIDPGHGGRDPGRPGPGDLEEKDIVLSVSRRLAGRLRERGYEVWLTRTTDTLIALADRPHLANEWKAGRPAALFLSIHANAFRPSVQGFETYFLSDAETEDERRVAEMENAAVEYEDRPSDSSEAPLQYILNHLRNDFYLRASNDLAEQVQRSLDRIHPGPNRGVRQAGFRVLVGAFMPAVLVELAFLSNAEEARMLASPGFQRDAAGALADAVETFFDTHEHLWLAGEGR